MPSPPKADIRPAHNFFHRLLLNHMEACCSPDIWFLLSLFYLLLLLFLVFQYIQMWMVIKVTCRLDLARNVQICFKAEVMGFWVWISIELGPFWVCDILRLSLEYVLPCGSKRISRDPERWGVKPAFGYWTCLERLEGCNKDVINVLCLHPMALRDLSLLLYNGWFPQEQDSGSSPLWGFLLLLPGSLIHSYRKVLWLPAWRPP